MLNFATSSSVAPAAARARSGRCGTQVGSVRGTSSRRPSPRRRLTFDPGCRRSPRSSHDGHVHDLWNLQRFGGVNAVRDHSVASGTEVTTCHPHSMPDDAERQFRRRRETLYDCRHATPPNGREARSALWADDVAPACPREASAVRHGTNGHRNGCTPDSSFSSTRGHALHPASLPPPPPPPPPHGHTHEAPLGGAAALRSSRGFRLEGAASDS